jgi:2-dehydropantoate 2-reductase
MQKVQTVAILGAGAMGAYFAAQFYQAPGFSTMLLASGERLEKLNKHGLVVNGVSYRIPALDPAQADAPVDLIIVALKHQHLKDAVHNLGKLVADKAFGIATPVNQTLFQIIEVLEHNA